MVDDIVTRLRTCNPIHDRLDGTMHTLLAAADEIERLRAAIRELQMIIAIEAEMAVDEALTDEEHEAEVWVRPRSPRKRITSNIRIKPGKALEERYGGDINAWALDIAETIKRHMRNGEAPRG